jgi:CHAT domain-containing protein
VAVYRHARDPKDEAIALFFLGSVDMNAGDVQNPRLHCGEATTHFYDRLLRGDSPADALRLAQLQLLQGGYSDPYQWAAFTLNGNPEGRRHSPPQE